MIRGGVDGQEKIFSRADYWLFKGSGGFVSEGESIPQICKKIGIAEQTYYRWRKEYGSLSVDQARRLKEVADLSLDKAVLREVAEEKY